MAQDHSIVPINSDYDLWSDGKDGNSALLSRPGRARRHRPPKMGGSSPRSEFDP